METFRKTLEFFIISYWMIWAMATVDPETEGPTSPIEKDDKIICVVNDPTVRELQLVLMKLGRQMNGLREEKPKNGERGEVFGKRMNKKLCNISRKMDIVAYVLKGELEDRYNFHGDLFGFRKGWTLVERKF